MPALSKKSQSILSQAHEDLQEIFDEVSKILDITILCANRSLGDQQKAYDSGHSKAKPGQSPHNYLPSLAVDSVPTIILGGKFVDKKGVTHILDWNSSDQTIQRFVRDQIMQMAGVVKAVAAERSIKIKWGGDFNTFEDLPHYELLDWETLKLKK